MSGMLVCGVRRLPPRVVWSVFLRTSVSTSFITASAGLMIEVPMFSKFLHGGAVLYPEQCMEVPYWFLPDQGSSLSPVFKKG